MSELLKKWALVTDGFAVNVSYNPDDEFHPDIAAKFVEVPVHVDLQWRLLDGEWISAVDQQVSLPVYFAGTESSKIGPNEFKLLFVSAERIGIKNLRATDEVLEDFMGIVEDARLPFVDLSLQSTRDGVAYAINALVAPGVVAATDVEDRIAQILSGVVQ